MGRQQWFPDLKPSNILINGGGQVWIGDFGSVLDETEDETLPGCFGTTQYAAPELYVEGSVCSRESDVFSFGLILYEILVGQPVYSATDSPLAIAKQVRTRRRPPIPPRVGCFMQGLIRRCWAENPMDRPSFDAIYVEFQAQGFDIIPGCNPDEIQEFCEAIVGWEAESERLHSLSLGSIGA